MGKLKKELTELILRLSDLDYESFCMNYRIENTGRYILQFIEDLQDEEEVAEIINEIHFNAELEY